MKRARRNLLHYNKLDEFKVYIISRGFKIEEIPDKSEYEVFRFRLPNDDLGMIWYRHTGKHLTMNNTAVKEFRKWKPTAKYSTNLGRGENKQCQVEE